MRDEDRPAVSAPRSFSKEGVTRFTRRSFNRHLLFLAERADVCGTEFKFDAASRCRASASLAHPRAWQAERRPYNFLVVAFDQPFNKFRIDIAGSSSQSMIEMANDQSFVTEAD